MTIIIIYAALYFTSFWYMLYLEPFIHHATGNAFTPLAYAIVALLSSFVLIGVLQLITNTWRTIRANLTYYRVQFYIWRIRRKYRIK